MARKESTLQDIHPPILIIINKKAVCSAESTGFHYFGHQFCQDSPRKFDKLPMLCREKALPFLDYTSN
jgi:hypothetical protein